MKKHAKLLTLLLTGVLLSGCGEKKEDTSEKAEVESTQEVTKEPTKEPTQEPMEEETQAKDKEIEIPNEEELKADYTSVEGLVMEKGSHIAVVVKNTEIGYWKAVKQGMNQAVTDLNEALGYTEEKDKIKCTFEGPKTETGVDEQVNILDAVLAENPDVLCLAAVDMDSCTAQLEMAEENGIPVIILDSGVNSEDLIYSVCATDNYAAGAEAAKKLCEKIGDEGQVAVLAHLQSGESSQNRVKGFQEEIEKNHPDVEVVQVSYEPSQEGETSTKEQMAAVLTLYPELKGYFCTNEVMSVTALEVLAEHPDREIQLVGFDLGKTQADAIRNGKEAGTITQNPYGMGYATIVAGVRAALDMENDHFIDAGYQWLDQTNIDLEDNAKYLYE